MAGYEKPLVLACEIVVAPLQDHFMGWVLAGIEAAYLMDFRGKARVDSFGY